METGSEGRGGRGAWGIDGAGRGCGMSFNARTYRPPGPVAEAFLRDRANTVRGIMGPFGSGKTNVCFFDALTCASQMPVCIDGIRRWRGFMFRDTFTKLWDTTIKSWWDWFPQGMGDWSGAHGRQGTHTLRFDMPDGKPLELQMEFRALDETGDIEASLKGVEASWAYMNEMDTQSQEVLTNIIGRVEQRRYPPQRLLPPTAFTTDAAGNRTPNYYVGVVGDMNPPDVDNWTYTLFEETRPSGHRLYKQPSGRSPQGENRSGVALASYVKLAELNRHRPDWVKRMVDGQYGPSRDGMPVYAEFIDSQHVSEEDLAPLPGLDLLLGFDQGVTGPAMVIAQYTYAGQLRVIDELVPNKRTGATAFGEACKLYLKLRYPGFTVRAPATVDPAGFAGGDKEQGDHAWADTVAEKLGIPFIAAETNELEPRHDGVRQLLTHNPGPIAEQGFLLSPRCKMLRKGFNSHYKYQMVGTGKNAVPAAKPKKNAWSNPHDALQYIVLGLFGISGVVKGVAKKGKRIDARDVRDDDDDDMPARGNSTDFNVFNT